MLLRLITIAIIVGSIGYASWGGVKTASEEMIIGVATVTDGDSLVIDGRRLRLEGVDAPEVDQRCVYRESKQWLCGERAAIELRQWLGQSTLICRKRGESYDRAVVVCNNGIKDVGEWLVESGWAVAEPCFSQSYIDEERVAHQKGAGIWASAFERPRDFRARKRGHQPKSAGKC